MPPIDASPSVCVGRNEAGGSSDRPIEVTDSLGLREPAEPAGRLEISKPVWNDMTWNAAGVGRSTSNWNGPKFGAAKARVASST
jgi:hypothetical protein